MFLYVYLIVDNEAIYIQVEQLAFLDWKQNFFAPFLAETCNTIRIR